MTAYYINRLMWMTFYTPARFVDGELPAHHHSNFDDEDDAHGAHGAADAHAAVADAHNPHGEQTGHEEASTGHDANADHGHGHGHGSVHESPNSMLVPLYVLAVLSIFFGLLAGPLFGNGFQHFFWHLRSRPTNWADWRRGGN